MTSQAEELSLDPSTTALLVIDMQRCFIDPSSRFAIAGAAPLIETINRLAAVCRDAGATVIHTAQVLRPDHSNAGTLPTLIPDVKDGMIDDGTEGAELHPELSVDPGDILLKKPRFSAFPGTDLALILRTRGIDTVVIGGAETHVCCESTARDASDRGFRVLFLSDGTVAGPRPDGGYSTDPQNAALNRIATFFGEVAAVQDVVDAVQRIASD